MGRKMGWALLAIALAACSVGVSDGKVRASGLVGAPASEEPTTREPATTMSHEPGDVGGDGPDRPVQTTAPPTRPCDPKDLRTALSTNRRDYAPDEQVVATTTIRNIGSRTCQVPRYESYDGCQPTMLVHFSFDPDRNGNYGEHNWLFGPYLTCPPPGLTLEPGESAARTSRFRFGQGRSGELPDADWLVVADWVEITSDGEQSATTTIRCRPGTCKPLAEYSAPTTTTRASSTG